MCKSIAKLVGVAATGIGLAVAAASAFAQSNSIQSLAAAQQGGRIVFRVEMKEPLKAVPPSFTIAQPPRIAFDFADTVNATGKASQSLNEANLRSVTMVQVGNRTRMVMNLSTLMSYETQVDGNNLLVSLVSSAGAISPRARWMAHRPHWMSKPRSAGLAGRRDRTASARW